MKLMRLVVKEALEWAADTTKGANPKSAFG